MSLFMQSELAEIGFQKLADGMVYRSEFWGQDKHWLRHTQLAMHRDGKWTVNGLGMRTPATLAQVVELIYLLFGEEV